MSVLLSCRDVVCHLGARLVLDGTSVDLVDSEAVALLGRSGSGKSTLLRVIAGLEVATRGEVFIAGEPATRDGRLLIPPHRRGMAMLFQDLALWPNLTVAGNVRLGLSGLRLPRSELKQRIEQSLQLCGIAELAARRPGTLSGGQQQRIALARAIAMQPKLLLLDEPFGGLDLLTKAAVVRKIARLKRKLGFAIILVSHDPAEVRELCDSLAVLEDARIVERGTAEEIAADPQSALGRAFSQTCQPQK